MDEKSRNKSIRYLVFLSYVIMLTLNTLANTIPINGQTTGEISHFYDNLFAPSGITFAIWGIIYILLLLYVFYQFGFGNKKISQNLPFYNEVGTYFIISSIANAAWILAWHNHLIWLSLILMAVILICLIMIILKLTKTNLALKDKVLLKLPFSIYFGWITVATIANVTTLLASLHWNGFGLSESSWTMILVIIGFVIGAIAMMCLRDVAYGLVIAWAYIGIIIRHASTYELNGMYPNIVIVTALCLTFLVLLIGYQLICPKKERE